MEHTRSFKNSGIGLGKDIYEYRYQIGYWHPDIHMEETIYSKKYQNRRLREKLDSNYILRLTFIFISFV